MRSPGVALNPEENPMDDAIAIGSERIIDGRLRVYYGGHWIKAYGVPTDSLEQKKQLIEALTRRLFNHVEHGLNIPGSRLAEARAAFAAEPDPRRRRVKGAMLAGAVFNRATDIFKKLVELQEMGVEILPDNALMRECGEHLQEALCLGKLVLHRSGDEGIDELWGEPFKAFLHPAQDFYRSRYVKIADAMTAIDRICSELSATLGGFAMFSGVKPLLAELCTAAKLKTETLRTDPEIFDVWARFVVATEALCAFKPDPSDVWSDPAVEQWAVRGVGLLEAGRDLISHIARARVTMPKSTRALIQRCEQFRDACCIQGSVATVVPELAATPSRLLRERADAGLQRRPFRDVRASARRSPSPG
jgi:hypothetical protein